LSGKPLRPDPHPIRDFFIKDFLVDYSPKDAAEVMERPFFPLTKNKRIKPMEYQSENGEIWVRVLALPQYGMATIYDLDVLIYLISRLLAQTEPGSNIAGDTVRCTPVEILRGVARGTGGKDYAALMDALNRLKNTTIETNIRAKNKLKVERFNWISNFSGVGDANGSQLNTLAITLPSWLLEGIRAGHVLTLDREYFLLTGGMEKALYRVARKHAGSQAHGFTVRLAILAKKVGCESPLPTFKMRCKRIAAADHLPRYAMTMTSTRSGEDAVHFVDRAFEDSRKALARREASVRKHRDPARTAWIDAQKDPRKFEAAYEDWHEQGNDPAAFATNIIRTQLF